MDSGANLEQKYQALIEAAGMAYVILDEAGRVVDANAEYLRLTGRERLEDILGQSPLAWTAPHDLSRNAEEIEKCMSTGQVRHLEVDYVDLQGRIIPVEINASAFTHPARSQVLTLCKDITQRRETERSLRSLETLFHLFMEHSPVHVFFKDADNRFLRMSRSFERLLGRPLEGLLGCRNLDLFPPDQARAMDQEEHQAIRDGARIQVDRELAGRECTTLVFPVTREGAPPMVAGFILDITERKRVERALIESETRYRSIFEQANIGMVEVSLEGRFLKVNAAFQAFLDRSEEELLGRHIREITHPAFHALDRERIEACIQGRIPQYVTEKLYLRKDGQEVWGRVHAALARDDQGLPLNLVAIVEDLSEWKRTEGALHRSEGMFRSLFEAMVEGVAIHDLVYDTQGQPVDYRIVDANPSFERQTGLSMQQCQGKLSREAFGAPEPPYLETYSRVAQTGEPATLESYFEPLQRHFRIRVFSHQPGSFATVFEDITERKRNEEERRRLEAEIQHAQKLESLGSLAGGVAHDMNNVLQAIQGMASVLKVKLASDAALSASLDIILNGCQRGRDLVKNLTEFARKGLQEPQPVDLNQIVRKEVDLLQHTTLQRIRLVTDLAEDLPPVLGDPSALSNALMNLCVNALDAMTGQGELCFRTRYLPDGYVEITVEDSGQGMAPEVLARAMEPFFTTKPLGKGTGLGLSGVYGTVKAHGGTMALRSEPGKGTCVILQFPACVAPKEAAAAVVSDAKPDAPSGLRVLMVDDDSLIRDSFTDLMELLGHEVAGTAESGPSALAMVQAGLDVDVVLLDQNMPGWSGVETFQRLRKVCPDLPVILCTGHLGDAAKRDLKGFARVWYLLKPYSLKEIEQVLQEVARSRP